MTHLKAIVFILLGLAVIVLVVQNNAALSTTVKFRMNPYFFQERVTSDITLYEVVHGVLLFNPGTASGFSSSGVHTIGILECGDTLKGEIIDLD